MCDGTSAVDGNTPGMLGYPCLDQIGRSTDSGFATAQALEPLYEWNNTDTYHGADVDIAVNLMCPEMADHIVEGRDYFNDTPRPGYTPYVYPHPLTWELDLRGAPDDGAIHLDWAVHAYLPPTTTWHIDYYTTTATAPFTATDPFSTTSAYTLTDHVINYQWYTVTLHAMVDSTSFLSDTVRVMPTDRFVFLPIAMKED